MTPNPPEILRDRGRSLEDEFFRREDKRLTERLNELRAAEATREALGKASGITKPAVLEKLMELGIRAETVAALSIVPLVEVAWADRALDAKERRVIVERAGSIGTQRQELCSRLGSIAAPTPNFSSRGRTWSRPCPSNSAQTRPLVSRWGCWIERAR
jgi:hypothetical protein